MQHAVHAYMHNYVYQGAQGGETKTPAHRAAAPTNPKDRSLDCDLIDTQWRAFVQIMQEFSEIREKES